MRLGNKKAMMTFFSITLFLVLAFLGVEIYEFVTLCHMKEQDYKLVHLHRSY